MYTCTMQQWYLPQITCNSGIVNDSFSCNQAFIELYNFPNSKNQQRMEPNNSLHIQTSILTYNKTNIKIQYKFIYFNLLRRLMNM